MKRKKDVAKLTPILVCICVALLFIIIVQISLLGKPKIGDFIPPEFDPSAVAGSPEGVPPTYSVIEADDADIDFGLCGEIAVDGGLAEVWFYNLNGNDAWLKLRVFDEGGAVVGESGIIKQGEHVRFIACEGDFSSGDKLSLKVMAYEPETYYSAGAVTVEVIVGEIK